VLAVEPALLAELAALFGKLDADGPAAPWICLAHAEGSGVARRGRRLE
jgi:hypothetical protein